MSGHENDETPLNLGGTPYFDPITLENLGFKIMFCSLAVYSLASKSLTLETS